MNNSRTDNASKKDIFETKLHVLGIVWKQSKWKINCAFWESERT